MLKAQGTVETEKASRYLKALCNHFNRKVTAEYEDDYGVVQFGFAYCEMRVTGSTLVIDIQAEDEANYDRAKSVVSDHLLRFSGDD